MENLKKQIQSVVNIYKSGNLNQAEILAKKLNYENPKVVFLYNLLGLIFVDQGKIDQAIDYYKKGLVIDPNFSMLYNNLGLLYSDYKSNNQEAEKFYKKAISLKQKIPEPYNNLGTLYKLCDRFEEAIKCYNEAIKIDSKFVHAYHNLGNAYTTIGNFTDAKKAFNKAISIDPFYTNSHRTLSRLIKYNPNEKHLELLIKIYKEIKPDDIINKTNMGFALGKAYEDIKDYDKSFEYYLEANTLYQKKINFSINETRDKFGRIKETFHRKIYEKFFNCGSTKSAPIFILGMPRSGTTLVEQILSNHPKVFGADEQEFILELLKKNFGNTNLRLFFEGIVDFNKDNLRDIGDEYINKMKNISNGFERSTDKMPENFFWIGFINLILPKAKVIHCYRNSKDNCLSIFKNHFPGGKINYSYDLNKIVEYYNLYSDLMNYWNNLIPNFIYNLKYEDLISNTESEIRNLLKFCKMEWDQNCLSFHNNKRAVKTASDVQARNKINSKSIDSWKKYEKHLNPFFAKLKD